MPNQHFTNNKNKQTSKKTTFLNFFWKKIRFVSKYVSTFVYEIYD